MSFVTIWGLSQFEFLSLVIILVFEFCHIFNIWIWSQFEFCHNLSFVTIWVLLVLSKFECLSFVTVWVFEFCHNLSFWGLVTIWVFELSHNLSFWVLSQFVFWVFSQFEFLGLVIIWVYQAIKKFCYWVFSWFADVTLNMCNLCREGVWEYWFVVSYCDRAGCGFHISAFFRTQIMEASWEKKQVDWNIGLWSRRTRQDKLAGLSVYGQVIILWEVVADKPIHTMPKIAWSLWHFPRGCRDCVSLYSKQTNAICFQLHDLPSSLMWLVNQNVQHHLVSSNKCWYRCSIC